MNNDDVILELIKAKKEGLKIEYSDLNFTSIVEEDHLWDLVNNTYNIIRPREYIICIPKKSVPYITELKNNWTKSDFGKTSDGDEFILMREVFKDDV